MCTLSEVCTWESGGGLCIEPKNEDALFDAIDYLQRHPDQALAMGLHGRDYVVQHYDWNVLARHYLEVLEQHAQPAKAAERPLARFSQSIRA